MGGGRFSEVYYKSSKRLGLKVSGRYREVAAIRRWPHLEVRLYLVLFPFLPVDHGNMFYVHMRKVIVFEKKSYPAVLHALHILDVGFCDVVTY